MTTVPTQRPDYESLKREFYSDPTRKPAIVPPDFTRIPEELRLEQRWVNWDWNRASGGTWTKVPLRPDGRKARSNDSSTWSPFEAVVEAYRSRGLAGIGFMLGGGYVGIDLDGVRDPDTWDMTRTARELRRGLGTYAEVSPSETGIKMFGRGTWAAAWHKKKLPDGGVLEVYGGGRFFTVTGHRIGTAGVNDIQSGLDDLVVRYTDPSPARPPAPDSPLPHPPDDDELIRRATAAENGEAFSRLWDGDTSGYASQSEADLALCGTLAFWTGGDADRLDRLFRRSRLMRPKWDEKHGDGTYGQRTIARALEGRTEFYSPGPTGNASPAAGTPPAAPKKASAAERLAGIGLSYDLWHDAKDRAYATIGRLSYKVTSTAFRRTLLNAFLSQTGGKVPGAQAVADAIRAIEAKAVCDGPEREAHVRLAGHAGRVYLYLADPESTVIEIDGDGWRPCGEPPVRFRKPSGMLPLPMPVAGGSLGELRHFVNVPDDASFALTVGWLAGAFQPGGPFPLLVLLGEQGSAKSTTARVVKRLIDPSEAGLRSEPREVRDLMIAAANGWAVAYDNLSYLPPWLSDALCRQATGGGFSTRTLYSDDDETIFESKRPVVLNGIEDFVSRADLLERGVLIRHPPIPEGNRRPESEFWAAFDAAHPRLLGAILDRVSAGHRELPGVKLTRLPRMADFARFAVACEQGAGEPPRFLAAYAENQERAHEQALEASPVAAALVAFMEGRSEWEGTATELREELARTFPQRGDGVTRVLPHGWPRAANTLSNCLWRLAPNLRRVHGLDVKCDGRTHRGRVVRVRRVTPSAGDRQAT